MIKAPRLQLPKDVTTTREELLHHGFASPAVRQKLSFHLLLRGLQCSFRGLSCDILAQSAHVRRYLARGSRSRCFGLKLLFLCVRSLRLLLGNGLELLENNLLLYLQKVKHDFPSEIFQATYVSPDEPLQLLGTIDEISESAHRLSWPPAHEGCLHDHCVLPSPFSMYPAQQGVFNQTALSQHLQDVSLCHGLCLKRYNGHALPRPFFLAEASTGARKVIWNDGFPCLRFQPALCRIRELPARIGEGCHLGESASWRAQATLADLI
mmetsp:Transcript_90496/g.161199  ORF Transcript_90496/g.161199 Transcript_90496/m.161199 type:complete len:266 (+) Transcript_90496:504-1301(+)